jgi:opacity protein-like surface antigen
LPWLAFEFETGYAFNGLDRLGYDEELDALLFQVPLLANVVVQCNNFGRFKPYVGVGVGGVMSLFMIDDLVTTGSGSVYLEGGESDMVFAYHAFAGMRYEIDDRWSVGLLYRCMGSSAASWEIEDDFGGSFGEIGFDDLVTHSISAQFELKF